MFKFDTVAKLQEHDASKSEASKQDAIILEAIRQVLFEDLGYKGNNRSYYDVNNSFIDKVSQPVYISLSLEYRKTFPINAIS